MSALAPPPERAEGRQGHYAGAASRLVAFAVDLGALWGLYTLGEAAIALATELTTGRKPTLQHHQILASIILAAWAFFYFSYQWALGGRTLGMALFGIRVVQAGGLPATGRQAVLRTLVLPLSFALAGLGLLLIVVQRERRALHDLIAGTAVVYGWDARAARLRWLAHRDRGAASAVARPSGDIGVPHRHVG